MFEMLGVVIGIQCAVANIELERKQIAAAKASLPPQQFEEYMAERAARFEEYMAERAARFELETVERRHREKCAAIRSTSFWRFGA